MSTEGNRADIFLQNALVATAKEHYKLVGTFGALLGGILVIYYCGSIQFYPTGLTVADSLFFLWVIVVFGFYYSVLVFGYFLASSFWVALLTKPLSWMVGKVSSKSRFVIPFPQNDRFLFFFCGAVANAVVLGLSLLSAHSLVGVVLAFILMGAIYTLLHNVTMSPWEDSRLVDSSGKRFFERRLPFNQAKFMLLGMIYATPLLVGEVGGGVSLTTFETMGIYISHADLVVPAEGYKPVLESLSADNFLEKFACEGATCLLAGVTVQFTGVGGSTKVQISGSAGNATMVFPNSAIKLTVKRSPARAGRS